MKKQKEADSETGGSILNIVGLVLAVIGGILTFNQNYGWGITMMFIGATLFFVAISAHMYGWGAVFAKATVPLQVFPVAIPFITLTISGTVLVTFALTKSMNNPFMWFFLLVAVVSGVHFSVALLKKSQRKSEERDYEEDDDRSDYERFVDEKLPQILIDYYSPLSEFPVERMIRSEFSSADEYKAALAEAEAQREEDRLENAKTYIGEAWEETDGVLEVTLTTKERTTDEDLVKRLPMVSSDLGAYGARVDNNPERPDGHVVVFIDMERQPSTLEKLSPVVDTCEFFSKHHMSNPLSIPMGIFPDGSLYTQPVAHTYVVGRTGSGKDSALQILIYHYAEYVKKGLVEFWVVDPKPSVTLPFAEAVATDADGEPIYELRTAVFHRIAQEDDDVVRLIREYHALLTAARSQPGTQRQNPVSKRHPLRFLLIDEFTGLVSDAAVMKQKDENGRTVEQMLKDIYKKGRSLNFYVIAAGQEATKEEAGNYLKNIPVRMAGYLESTYEMSKALNISEGDFEKFPELIPQLPRSTAANGYKYSGIFNIVRDEDSSRLAMRMPFLSDDDIRARAEELGFWKAPATPNTYAELAGNTLVVQESLTNTERSTPVSTTELDDVFASFDED